MKQSRLFPLAIVTISMILAALAWWHIKSPDAPSLVARDQSVEEGKKTEPSFVNATKLPPYARREVGNAFVFVRGSALRPPGDPRAWIDSLKPAAQAGDAEASYSIYLALMDCEMYLKASAPEELAESRSIGASPEYEKTVLRKLTECESLAPLQHGEIGHWLSKAASQGSIEALVAYAASPNAILGPNPDKDSDEFRNWQSNVTSYLNEALQKGSIDALSQLSNAYMADYALPRNPEKAYATQLALSAINPDFSSEAYRNSIAKELTPAQIARAREEGRKLFQIVTQEKRTTP
jgi:hypothetical protein